MDPSDQPGKHNIENPYAPPESMFARELGPSPFGRLDFTVGDLVSWTWSLYRQRFPACMTVVWGALAVNFGINLLSNLLLTAVLTVVRDQIMAVILQIAVTFATIVAGFWIQVGITLSLLKIARQQIVAFDDIFTGGRFVLTTILAWIVCMLCVGGPFALAAAGVSAIIGLLGNDPTFLIVIASFVVIGVLVATACYVGIRLSQYTFVVVDQNAGVFESLRTSWVLTRRQTPTLILVYLTWTALLLAGVLACCAGVIFTAPMGNLLLAVTYQALTGRTPVAEVEFIEDFQ